MKTIVFAAGGTGGHLYPAVALAREFFRQDPDTRMLFVGTERGIESKVLAHEGYELAMIAAQPVMGRGLLKAAGALLSLPRGLWQSVALLRTRRASFVLGVGGYTSPPVLVAAKLLGLPRAILEPNAYPGMANKALGPIADLVFVAYREAAGHFPATKVRVTGMPVRRGFEEPSEEDTADTVARRTLLVFGGSQGARAINDAMVAALPQWAAMRDQVVIVHQTGEADHARVREAYQAAGVQAEVVPFLFEMPKTLRSADLVVSRAGAMTLAELTVCGKPAILIPLPHAIYQHQAHNARVLADAGGAVVLPQQELTGERLAQEVSALLREPERLQAMAGRSRGMGRPDATQAIVGECLALMKRKARGDRQ
ncbi:MAG: undecaprenyldiphospho-muramoylpentapeptide beta-N-acetylglucosaminyltransferase [Nitrospirae bacterium RIFCSPLOWO2_02_FULL_62_14]|nr:MAG: undecaprenyldiphospho-muramoylpentapeptide beta-N-acetylglucosaminyltransferase [Nitrospirae bacterium RIFCSPLOWO2_02_FULL_62_14]OGW69788.1 MAG: undecaprenyldiphospho-muramoylpentapeptide beta-N-acetylglucosaminyltransferase [Nitrospirae bacterium RIFCSPLOWO2_01_FULL_62_17]